MLMNLKGNWPSHLNVSTLSNKRVCNREKCFILNNLAANLSIELITEVIFLVKDGCTCRIMTLVRLDTRHVECHGALGKVCVFKQYQILTNKHFCTVDSP